MSDKSTPRTSGKDYKMSGQFTPDNSALVLIDHRVGTLQFVYTMPPDESLRNAVMLAKTAKRYGMPVVLTTSQEDHIQGPTAPALQQAMPEGYNNRVKRAGIVNAWADPNFSAAVRATGRKKLSSSRERGVKSKKQQTEGATTWWTKHLNTLQCRPMISNAI